MHPPRPEVAEFSREALDGYLADLVALDAEVLGLMGDAYSDEAWGGDAFRWEVPGKWELSAVALCGGRPCGFWIASRRTPGLHYTHRVAVAPWARSLGLGTLLFNVVAAKARAGGFHEMGLSVAAGNAAAMQFYERLGFARATGSDLDRVMGRPVQADRAGDAYRTPSGHRNHVYLLHLTSRNG